MVKEEAMDDKDNDDDDEEEKKGGADSDDSDEESIPPMETEREKLGSVINTKSMEFLKLLFITSTT